MNNTKKQSHLITLTFLLLTIIQLASPFKQSRAKNCNNATPQLNPLKTGKVEITSIEAFNPGYIAVFSCPQSTYFSQPQPPTGYTLQVLMHVANTENPATLEETPIAVDSDGETSYKSITMAKTSYFNITLNSTDFNTLFGEEYKQNCEYNWGNFDKIVVDKVGSEVEPAKSSHFVGEYEHACDVYDLALNFIANCLSTVNLSISEVNLVQSEYGKGNSLERGYKLTYEYFGEDEGDGREMFIASNEYQETLKKLFEQDYFDGETTTTSSEQTTNTTTASSSEKTTTTSSSSQETPSGRPSTPIGSVPTTTTNVETTTSDNGDEGNEWYKIWWVWLIIGSSILILIVVIILCLVNRNKNEEIEKPDVKQVEVNDIT